jgi:hypothetical protein
MFFTPKALTGNYKIDHGCLDRHLTLVALDFDTTDDSFSVNAKLAKYIRQLDGLENMAVYAQSLIYGILVRGQNDRSNAAGQKSARNPAKLIELPSAGAKFFGQKAENGESGDSYDALAKAAAQLPKGATVILVCQAYHASRVQKQAALLGLKALLPPGLPRDFSHNGNQPWTRNPTLWRIREIPGQIFLHLSKKL